MSGTDYTFTTNYQLYKPVPNADNDAWGGHLNQNADALDALIHALNTGNGPYLKLAGGALTGALTLAADPTTPLGAATKAYADGKLALAGGILTGSVGIGITPPAGAQPALFSGPMTIRQNIASAPTALRFNAYTTGTVINYLENGPAGIIALDNSTGVLRLGAVGTGTAGGSIASFPGYITVDANGILTINSGIAPPAIAAGTRGTGANDCMNIWATYAGDGGLVALRGPTFTALPNATQIYAGPASARKNWDFQQNGVLNLPASVVLPIGSGLYFDAALASAIYKNAPGDIVWQAGPGYYLSRSGADGAWRFVENNTTNFALDQAGNFTARNNVSANNYWIGAYGGWLSSYINQAVLTTSQPTFNNIFVSSLGNWLSVFLNQGVKSTDWPTFAGVAATTGITMAGRAVMVVNNAKELTYIGGSGGPTGVVLNGWDNANSLYGIFVDAVSDIRIKENIVNTEVDALAALRAVPVRQYNVKAEYAAYFAGVGKSDKERARLFADAKPAHVPIGLITQEILPHIPEAVHVQTSGDNPGSPLPSDAQRLRLDQFVPYLVKAIQELDGRIVALEKGE